MYVYIYTYVCTCTCTCTCICVDLYIYIYVCMCDHSPMVLYTPLAYIFCNIWEGFDISHVKCMKPMGEQ